MAKLVPVRVGPLDHNFLLVNFAREMWSYLASFGLKWECTTDLVIPIYRGVSRLGITLKGQTNVWLVTLTQCVGMSQTQHQISHTGSHSNWLVPHTTMSAVSMGIPGLHYWDGASMCIYQGTQQMPWSLTPQPVVTSVIPECLSISVALIPPFRNQYQYFGVNVWLNILILILCSSVH